MRTKSGVLSTRWLFTGEQRDSESELYYLRARYYDPAVGRFLGEDPFRGWAVSPQSHNPYAYVMNNPALYVDPMGLDPFWEDAAEWISDQAGKFWSCLSNPDDCTRETLESAANWFLDVTYPIRAPMTIALENFISMYSWGDVHSKEGGIRIVSNCQGLCRILMDYPLQGAEAFTVGHTIFARNEILNRPVTLQEELNHVRQYELLGDYFLVTYLANVIVALPVCGFDVQCHRNLNILERTAQP